MAIYRVAVLSAILLTGAGFTSSAGAQTSPQKEATFQGVCRASDDVAMPNPSTTYGTISESDGVKKVPNMGTESSMVDPKLWDAAIAEAKATGMRLGADGFLWKIEPVSCDEIQVLQMGDRGRTAVTFLNGAKDHVLSFVGNVQGTSYFDNGNLLFADTIYLTDGQPTPIGPGSNVPRCEIDYQNFGPNTPIPTAEIKKLQEITAKAKAEPNGTKQKALLAQVQAEAKTKLNWATRISFVTCQARIKYADGHLLLVDIGMKTTKMLSSAPASGAPDKQPESEPQTQPAPQATSKPAQPEAQKSGPSESTSRTGTTQPFVSTAGRFSVVFPATPQQSSGQMDCGNGEKGPLYEFSASTEKVGHIVVYGDCPLDAIGDSPQAFLQAMEKSAIAHQFLTEEHGFDLNGVPGRAFISVEPGVGVHITHEFLAGTRFYLLTMIGGGQEAAETDQFLDSFKIFRAGEEETPNAPRP